MTCTPDSHIVKDPWPDCSAADLQIEHLLSIVQAHVPFRLLAYVLVRDLHPYTTPFRMALKLMCLCSPAIALFPHKRLKTHPSTSRCIRRYKNAVYPYLQVHLHIDVLL